METALLGIVTVVTAAVEYVRPLLSQVKEWNELTKQQQAIVLQTIAWVASVGACFAQNVNLFGVADEPVGTIATGLMIGLGGQGLHVALALLGKLGNVTGETQFKSELADMIVSDENYTAWS